jgi:hypothetical protein
MTTITFLHKEYEATIDGIDIRLWCIEEEVILIGAASGLEAEANDFATYELDRYGNFYVDRYLFSEYIEDNIEEYCEKWATDGKSIEVINYNLN